MEAIKIILLCVAAAIIYGVIHDQITARICVEYFTIGHPPVFNTTSPTLLGLGWGIIATWWVGLILGVALAFAARLGKSPKRTTISLIRPLLVLLLIMACCAAAAGFAGFIAAKNGWVFLVEPMASQVPADKQVRFLVALWMHLTSYFVGFVGGFVVIAQTWQSRSA
jgi:hypothetical protein